MKVKADPSRVVGYIRVSTDEQHLGPEAQLEAMQRWCKANAAVLVAVHQDLGISGSAELDKRPGLTAALADLRTLGAGTLLVAKRDRLARDVVVAAMVERLAERSGARLLAADGTGNGEGPEASLMRGIVDVFAQYERALIRSRTKAALAVKASRGERVGQVPIGKRLGPDGTRLEAEPAEERVIARIVQLRRAGTSTRLIASMLNDEGAPARGARWHVTSVARILRRAA
jgi:site-specific DNA recombinase